MAYKNDLFILSEIGAQLTAQLNPLFKSTMLFVYIIFIQYGSVCAWLRGSMQIPNPESLAINTKIQKQILFLAWNKLFSNMKGKKDGITNEIHPSLFNFMGKKEILSFKSNMIK